MKTRTLLRIVGGCAVALAGTARTTAAPPLPSLFEFGINRDGLYSSALPPGGLFDPVTGLGLVQLTFLGAGPHSGILFVDHELSEGVNTFFNELGSVSGSPPAGVSWEIDEPGYTFGDIFGNVLAGTLDNSIGTPNRDDVSMAMGWDFNLVGDEVGTLSFLLSDTRPASSFYLRHWDPDSGEQVFFSSSLTIRGGGIVIPEGNAVLAGLGLGFVVLASRWCLRRGAAGRRD